jgi:hypothetical protein
MSNGTTVTMETREEPRFVQFTTGEIVEGVLMGVQPIQIKDKRGLRYIVQEDNGELVSFLGTWQINTKLRPADLGHRVSVKCIGTDTMVQRGDNCMKVFEIKVSKEMVNPGRVVSDSETEITDADIPF